MQPEAVAFVKAFFDAGKRVASICHGPWTVIEPAQRGRRMTSWPSLKTDLAERRRGLGESGSSGGPRAW
jgi:deglycase